jgi:hypothetical protein
VKLGLNRIFWEFERDGEAWPQRELVTETPELPPAGRPVLPGEYEATVRFLGVEQSAKFRVLPDPRAEVTMQARIEKDNLLASALEGTRIYRDALQRYARAKKDIDLVRARLDAEPKPKKGTDDPNKPLRDAIDAVQKEVDACDEALFGKKPQQGIALGEGFQHDFFEQMGRINDTPDAPNETERMAVDRAKLKATEAAARIDAFLNGPKKTFVEAIEKSGLAWLQPAK